MEYYKKSIRLLKILLGFVIFCAVYAFVIQPNIRFTPKINQLPKQQQPNPDGSMPEPDSNVQVGDDINANNIQINNTPQMTEEEFVSRAFVRYKKVHPELNPDKEAEVIEILRKEYNSSMQNTGSPSDNQAPNNDMGPVPQENIGMPQGE